MFGTGYIVQYHSEKRRGMIHLGGEDHSALLDFAPSDCDKAVRIALEQGAIPHAPAIKVKFDVAIKNGGLWATKVLLASHRAASSKKTGARKSTKKARTKRRR